MTAKDKFLLGQRVKMTAEAKRYGVFHEGEATIAGFYDAAPNMVRVRWRENAPPSDYHMDFWAPIKRSSKPTVSAKS